MQSVKTPLLVEENVSSLSSLVIVPDDNRTVDLPDNRRHIHQINSAFSSSNKPATNKKQPPKASSTSSRTNDDDDDEEDDDGDPLLRDSNTTTMIATNGAATTTTMRKPPSTLFSPMSESGDSSFVGGSASQSALATPMEISR